jgi:V8-like Glu-specific endopeptidase
MRRVGLLVLLAGAIFLQSGSAFADDPFDPEDVQSVRDVAGKDETEPMLSSSFPWSAIGRITSDGLPKGTGFLIGDDTVVTNAHVAMDDDGKQRPNLRFLPNLKQSKYTYHSGVLHVWSGKRTSLDDYAILRIESPLGKQFKFFTLWAASLETLLLPSMRGRLLMAGYSGDRDGGNTASVDKSCNITGDAETLGYYHNCHIAPGSSGSPIFGFFKGGTHVVAVNWGGGGNEPKPNVASPVSRFFNIAKDILASKNYRSTRTNVHICNNSNTPVLTLSVAFVQNSKWRSVGFYNVAKGSCAEIPLGENYSGDYYFRREGISGVFVKGASFCIIPGKTFDIMNEVKDGKLICGGEHKAADFEKGPAAVKFGEMNVVSMP